MAALSDSRDTQQLGVLPVPDVISAPIAADTVCYAGGLGCLNASGLAVPGSTATTLRAVGRIRKTVNNAGGAASAKTVEFERGVFKFANSASGDLIAQADVLTNCYIVDDQTVAKTDGSSARSIAGKVIKVESDGVYVHVGG